MTRCGLPVPEAVVGRRLRLEDPQPTLDPRAEHGEDRGQHDHGARPRPGPTTATPAYANERR